MELMLSKVPKTGAKIKNQSLLYPDNCANHLKINCPVLQIPKN